MFQHSTHRHSEGYVNFPLVRAFSEYVRFRNRFIWPMLLPQDKEKVKKRLMGCITGLAVGDILGCPVEGLSYQDIQRRYGEVRGLVEQEYSHHWRLPGLHSDDTQQALAVIIALQSHQGLNNQGKHAAEDVAKRLATIYVEGFLADLGRDAFGCWRGTGRGFRTVVENLYWHSKSEGWPFGLGVQSAGLGAVMRIPPVGLLVESNASILAVVKNITQITHTDPLAVISSYVIAFAVSLLSKVTHDDFNKQDFLNTLVEETEIAEETIFNAFPEKKSERIMSSLLRIFEKLNTSIPPGQAMRNIVDTVYQITGKRLPPLSGYAPSGVVASLYFFLHNWDNPIEGVLMAINAGGDTDTIGAIVGSLFGTLYGPEVYKKFASMVVGLDVLVDTVYNYKKHDKKDPIGNFIDRESNLTALENYFRQAYRKIS